MQDGELKNEMEEIVAMLHYFPSPCLVLAPKLGLTY